MCAPQVNVGVTLTRSKPLFSAVASIILRNTTYQGSVRGLDFNPNQITSLLSSAVNSEVSTMMHVVVYSMLSDFYKSTSAISRTPGAHLSKLDEIISVSWNR